MRFKICHGMLVVYHCAFVVSVCDYAECAKRLTKAMGNLIMAILFICTHLQAVARTPRLEICLNILERLLNVPGLCHQPIKVSSLSHVAHIRPHFPQSCQPLGTSSLHIYIYMEGHHRTETQLKIRINTFLRHTTDAGVSGGGGRSRCAHLATNSSTSCL